MCGLPFPFTPPELCPSRRRDAVADGVAVDMWSVGMLIFHLFTADNTKLGQVDKESSPEWSGHAYSKIFREVGIRLDFIFIHLHLNMCVHGHGF